MKKILEFILAKYFGIKRIWIEEFHIRKVAENQKAVLFFDTYDPINNVYIHEHAFKKEKKMKHMYCKLFGHKWNHKWHRHNSYFAAECTRCHKQVHRTNKTGLIELNKERTECLLKVFGIVGLFIMLVALGFTVWFFYIQIGG